MVSTSVLYISLDGASTFQRVSLDFKLKSSLLFHSSRSDLVLALDEDKVIGFVHAFGMR